MIKPASALPPIKGPVTIEGTAWKQTGAFVAIDGSGYIEDKGPQTCPGAVAGQFGTTIRPTTLPGLALVDTQGVDISGRGLTRGLNRLPRCAGATRLGRGRGRPDPLGRAR